MNADDLATGRRLLAALTPGPYFLSCYPSASVQGYGVAPLPLSTTECMERIEDARAILWLLQHAETLLTLAERVAAVRVQTSPAMQTSAAECLALLKTSISPGDSSSTRAKHYAADALAYSYARALLADAITLAALVEQVHR